ncbi:MAG: hypothetical protein WD824_23680 [Cyclobacteriaceae bacterium]
MKKLIFLSLVSILSASTALFAQNPVPDSDTIPNPVQEGDPAVRQLPPRLDYVDDKKRITPEEIPDPVRVTLEGSAQYTDWQKAMIYHDKNKDEYVVEFKEGGKTTTHRFNKEGRPIVEE